jgi:hypothetical protein
LDLHQRLLAAALATPGLTLLAALALLTWLILLAALRAGGLTRG